MPGRGAELDLLQVRGVRVGRRAEGPSPSTARWRAHLRRAPGERGLGWPAGIGWALVVPPPGWLRALGYVQ